MNINDQKNIVEKLIEEFKKAGEESIQLAKRGVKIKVKDVREIFERSILKDEVIKRLVADKNLWSELEKTRKRL